MLLAPGSFVLRLAPTLCQKLYINNQTSRTDCWSRQGRQDRGGEKDEKGRDKSSCGEGGRTTARAPAARTIKTRSTTSRITSVRWTTKTAEFGLTVIRITAVRTGMRSKTKWTMARRTAVVRSNAIMAAVTRPIRPRQRWTQQGRGPWSPTAGRVSRLL